MLFILREGENPEGEQLLSKNILEKKFLNHSYRYGFGWEINNNIIGHGGYAPPTNSHVKLIFEHYLGVVVITNTDNTRMHLKIESITERILHSFRRAN
ncbi:hypothetical protein [Natronospora cellulosivora (SeqCode)]